MRNDKREDEKLAKKQIGINDYETLTSAGTIGQYEEGELTHIFLIENKKVFHHYFALLSFDEFREPDAKMRDIPITSSLIPIDSHFSMGIFKKRKILSDCRAIFQQLCENKLKIDGVDFILHSEFQLLPKTYVPSIWGYDSVFLTKILKPNFWGDNYVIEFGALQNPMEDLLNAELVGRVNAEIKNAISIDLASVHDRIGSFLFQFPITMVSGQSGISKDWTKATVELNFDPSFVENNNIISVVTTKLDNVVTGNQSFRGRTPPEVLIIGDSNNLELKIFNETNGIIYHNSMVNFVRSVNFSMGIGGHNSEPRTYLDSTGIAHEISLVSYSQGVKTSKESGYDTRTKKRIFQNEIVTKSGRFISVRKGERNKALDFLRKQILEKAVTCSEIWLWDPFLDYNDIFDTLYCVGNSDVLMKCITSYQKNKIRTDASTETSGFENFKRLQKTKLLSRSNHLGINLTLRACHDNFGFNFHDRFLLLIPKEIDEVPTVFSLGTSINGLGKSHHLIQQTLDPRNIIETFLELWNLLDNDESTVIKLPEDKK